VAVVGEEERVGDGEVADGEGDDEDEGEGG
jgi:hypothetical protein